MSKKITALVWRALCIFSFMHCQCQIYLDSIRVKEALLHWLKSWCGKACVTLTSYSEKVTKGTGLVCQLIHEIICGLRWHNFFYHRILCDYVFSSRETEEVNVLGCHLFFDLTETDSLWITIFWSCAIASSYLPLSDFPGSWPWGDKIWYRLWPPTQRSSLSSEILNW